MQELRFNFARMKEELAVNKAKGIQFENLEELARFTALHEAGHIIDQRKTQMPEIASTYLARIYRATIHGDKNTVSKLYRIYQRINYRLEKRAWEIGRAFVREDRLEVYDTYACACHKTYKDMHKMEYKALYILALIHKKWSQTFKRVPITFNFLTREASGFKFDEKTKTLTVSIPSKQRYKSGVEGLSRVDSILFGMLYRYEEKRSDGEGVDWVEEHAFACAELGDFEEAIRARDYYEQKAIIHEEQLIQTLEKYIDKDNAAWQKYKAKKLHMVEVTLRSINRYMERQRKIQSEKQA
jgi:hypothetical protein